MDRLQRPEHGRKHSVGTHLKLSTYFPYQQIFVLTETCTVIVTIDCHK